MHCVHVKEVAHDSSKRFSRGRHFYKRLLLAGTGGRSKARLEDSGGRSKARRDGRVKGRGSRERGSSECGPTEWIRDRLSVRTVSIVFVMRYDDIHMLSYNFNNA